jgi:sugar O-acyltransferase (sialic acid O-acetyltransferase NeuD family)
VVIYGGGGHGRSVIDLVRALGGFELVGVIDDSLEPEEQVMGVPVLGGSEKLSGLASGGVRLAVNAVGGVGDVQTRIEVFDRIREAGMTCPTLIHPTAFVEPSASLSQGVQVLPQAYVGSCARLGFGVIVNNGAIVSHDCRVEDYASLAPGATLAGEVTVGRGVQIGMGVTVNLRLTVGAWSLVGNSAVVKRDVPPETRVRAGSLWPPR